MSKSLRDKELFLVLSRKNNAVPFSESLGTLTKVNCNVKHFSVYHTYQFVLRIVDLEMKSAENTVTGAGLVILNKLHINSGFLEIVVIVSFHEISSGIPKNSWLDHFQSFNISALCYFYFSHFSFSFSIYVCFCVSFYVSFLSLREPQEGLSESES